MYTVRPVQSPWLRPFLAVVAAGLIVWLVLLLLEDGDDVELTAGEPRVVSVAELEAFAEDADQPVYWLGEKPDREYELTENADGRIFVRYLPPGARNPARGGYLTVGTYAMEDAVGALRRSADEGEGRELGRSGEGAVILIDPASPDNAHFAYPGEDVQIEIFSPAPGRALRLAASDRARPVP